MVVKDIRERCLLRSVISLAELETCHESEPTKVMIDDKPKRLCAL